MINLVRLSPISGLAIKTHFDLGCYTKVLLVEIFRTDVERCDLGEGRWRSETALFDVLNFVVRDKMLGYAVDGERERLGERESKKRGLAKRGKTSTFLTMPPNLNLYELVKLPTRHLSLALSIPTLSPLGRLREVDSFRPGSGRLSPGVASAEWSPDLERRVAPRFSVSL